MNDNTVHTSETIEGVRYRIIADDDSQACDPRDWDNLGTMVCWHKRYNLSDKHAFSDPQEARAFFKARACTYLGVSLYDHSGLTMYVGHKPALGDAAGWDSGPVGYVYATRERIESEYLLHAYTMTVPLESRPTGVYAKAAPRDWWETLTASQRGGYMKAWRRRALAVMTQEVATYARWLEGNVYGYVVEKVDDEGDVYETLDSCWGYIGYSDDAYMIGEAEASARYQREQRREQRTAREEADHAD